MLPNHKRLPDRVNEREEEIDDETDAGGVEMLGIAEIAMKQVQWRGNPAGEMQPVIADLPKGAKVCPLLSIVGHHYAQCIETKCAMYETYLGVCGLKTNAG